MYSAAFGDLGSNRTCGAAAGRVTCQAIHWDANGPYLPSAVVVSAEPQLHQTGHSSTLQHFRRAKVRYADETDIVQ